MSLILVCPTNLLILEQFSNIARQVLSVHEAEQLGVESGSRVVDKTSLDDVRADLIRGLVMLEGSLPSTMINPAMHHFAHYGEQTARLGVLRWLSMHCFERHNKKIKGLVRSTKDPLCSLANNVGLDISTRYLDIKEGKDVLDKNPHKLKLCGKGKFYRYTNFSKY